MDNLEANLESFDWAKKFVKEIALGTMSKLGIKEPFMKTVLEI